MPPLDTGAVHHTLRVVDPLVERAEPTPRDFPTVGAYLRAIRERRGRPLPEVGAATRIRREYLAAIEEANYSALPSRPFAIGYVRAYADALGLDGESAAERFKSEMPDGAGPLRAPIGVKHDRSANRPLIFAGVAAVIAAVVTWNIVQRTITKNEPSAPSSSSVVASAPVEAEAPAPQGPIALGAPTPPPAEQTTPTPYVTPGLGPQPDPAAAPSATAAKPTVTRPTGPSTNGAPAVFEPKGAVYGAAGKGPAVVLQARKRASLIVRGAAGEVYFARQLAAGDAYRAPIGQRLSVDVTDPAAFSVYINGQLRGALAVEKTLLDKVAVEIVKAAPPPAPSTVARPAAGAAPTQAAPAAPAQPAAPTEAVPAEPAPAPGQ